MTVLWPDWQLGAAAVVVLLGIGEGGAESGGVGGVGGVDRCQEFWVFPALTHRKCNLINPTKKWLTHWFSVPTTLPLSEPKIVFLLQGKKRCFLSKFCITNYTFDVVVAVNSTFLNKRKDSNFSFVGTSVVRSVDFTKTSNTRLNQSLPTKVKVWSKLLTKVTKLWAIISFLLQSLLNVTKWSINASNCWKFEKSAEYCEASRRAPLTALPVGIFLILNANFRITTNSSRLFGI